MRHEDHVAAVLQCNRLCIIVTIQKYADKIFERDAARRRVILDAAATASLKFGYAKSSLEDIAKQAADRDR